MLLFTNYYILIIIYFLENYTNFYKKSIYKMILTIYNKIHQKVNFLQNNKGVDNMHV